MRTGTNMALVIWDEGNDPYDHNELAANWDAVNEHDHTEGRGKRLVTASISPNAITNPLLAPDAVTTDEILNGTILAEDLAPGIIGEDQLDPDLLKTLKPLGQVFAFFRPTTGVPLPGGCVVCDGASYATNAHDFGTGQSITVPDLRNRFILGAALSGTGTDPSTAPAEKATGGSNTRSFNHSHTLGSHSHTIPAHSHVVDNHSHQVDSHSHTVDHHAHGILAQGDHDHNIYSRLTRTLSQDGQGTSYLQTLYVTGFNTGGENARIPASGGHNHWGSTEGASPGTTASAPGTSGAAPGTSAVALSTSSASGSTDAATVGGDIRPAFVGLLYLVRIRYGA